MDRTQQIDKLGQLLASYLPADSDVSPEVVARLENARIRAIARRASVQPVGRNVLAFRLLRSRTALALSALTLALGVVLVQSYDPPSWADFGYQGEAESAPYPLDN